MISAMLIAALVQSAAINSQRDKYISCLDTAAATAKTQKMPVDAFEPYLRQTCAAAETSFKASLIAFDMKNKVSRKQATADAQLQADDFVISSVDQYKQALARGERG
jgi:hypothetical protein